MRKGSPERRAFFYAIASVIFKNKEQKCKEKHDFIHNFLHKSRVLVGRGGFEPPKSKTSDLQSDPFGRSGICPYFVVRCGAGDWTRTHNLLITNQLLCH